MCAWSRLAASPVAPAGAAAAIGLTSRESSRAIEVPGVRLNAVETCKTSSAGLAAAGATGGLGPAAAGGGALLLGGGLAAQNTRTEAARRSLSGGRGIWSVSQALSCESQRCRSAADFSPCCSSMCDTQFVVKQVTGNIAENSRGKGIRGVRAWQRPTGTTMHLRQGTYNAHFNALERLIYPVTACTRA